MSHLLDTNICAAHFRRPGGLAHRFIQYGGGLHVPTIVLGELYAGAYHVSNPTPLLQQIADLPTDVQVLGYGGACAEQFGKIRGRLLQQGVSVPTADLMIAAVALVHNLTLVTNNTSDFQKSPACDVKTGLPHEGKQAAGSPRCGPGGKPSKASLICGASC